MPVATDTGSASLAWVGWRPGPTSARGRTPATAEPIESAGSKPAGDARLPAKPRAAASCPNAPTAHRSASSKALTRRSTSSATASAPCAIGSKPGGGSLARGARAFPNRRRAARSASAATRSSLASHRARSGYTHTKLALPRGPLPAHPGKSGTVGAGQACHRANATHTW